MRTSTFEILVYRRVYRALRQKISCVARAPLVNPHLRDSQTRFARAANFILERDSTTCRPCHTIYYFQPRSRKKV